MGTVTGSVYLIDLAAKAVAATVTERGHSVQCLAWRKLTAQQPVSEGSPRAPATPSLSPGQQVIPAQPAESLRGFKTPGLPVASLSAQACAALITLYHSPALFLSGLLLEREQGHFYCTWPSARCQCADEQLACVLPRLYKDIHNPGPVLLSCPHSWHLLLAHLCLAAMPGQYDVCKQASPVVFDAQQAAVGDCRLAWRTQMEHRARLKAKAAPAAQPQAPARVPTPLEPPARQGVSRQPPPPPVPKPSLAGQHLPQDRPCPFLSGY